MQRWIRWCLLPMSCALFALASLPHPATAAPKGGNLQAAQKLAADAEAAYMARNYERAAELYAEAIRNFEHENLHFTHGRSLEHLSRFAEAAGAFGRATALTTVDAVRNVTSFRAAANRKLDEAQQHLADGQLAAAQVSARSGHAVLLRQAKRAEDGKVYPEPASVQLLLGRIELALGNVAAAQTLFAEIRSDPTAPEKVIERATQLAAGPVGKAPEPPAKPVVVVPVKVEPPPPPKVESSPVGRKDPAPVVVVPAPKPAAVTKPAVVDVVVPAPASGGRSKAPWAALGVSAAVAVGGAAWWGVASSQASDIQAKLDKAKATGGSVAGLTQADYAAAKASADRGYQYGSVLAIVGAAAAAGSLVWMALSGDASAPKVSIGPMADAGWQLAVAGGW